MKLPRRKVLHLAAGAALPAFFSQSPADAAPKHAAYVRSTASLPSNHFGGTLAQVSLNRGLSGRFLEVVVTVFQPRGTNRIDVSTPIVNGVAFMDASTDSSIDCPGASSETSCPVTIMWWLDLDVAESWHPGQIIGRPLNVKLDALDTSGVAVSVTTNMAARYLKRK
jgi:hypothetical protein